MLCILVKLYLTLSAHVQRGYCSSTQFVGECACACACAGACAGACG